MISSGAVRFRYIAVEGPIGAGKTSLAERLSARLDATLILEDTENPFLPDFYADRPGAALQAQLFFLLSRHRQQTSLRQADLFTQVTISDYLFDKDKIFAYVNLDDNELFIYQRLYDLLSRDAPPPDLVVYLQAPTDVLLRRLRLRRADPEMAAFDPDPEYLKELNEAKRAPRNFAFVNAPAGGGLLMSRKKIAGSAAKEKQKECGGGGLIIRGRCK